MEKQTTDFNSYKLEDFVSDPDFVSWAFTSNDQLSAYWNRIKKEYPEKVKLIDDALHIILSLRFNADFMSETEQLLLWDSIIKKAHVNKKTAPIIPLWLRSIAAVLLVGIVISLLFRYYNRPIIFSTGYGQLKSITLPDGSMVTLNAHSQLHYSRNWNKVHIREVWIDGEAFFKVNHLHRFGPVTQGERFIVHAHNVNVEVLGTSFNINDRRGLVSVSLITGKISLRIFAKEKSHLIMKPGDELTYNPVLDTIIKIKGKTTRFALWKNGELNFDNTPVSEVFKYIEDIYGYQVILKNSVIAQKKLSGSFANTNENILFKALSTALGISIQKDSARHQLTVK